MNGRYLDMQMRQWVVRPIVAFREYIFSDVLPAFVDLDKRATKIADDYFEGIGAQPASEDFDGGMSEYAEDAQERGQSWYNMMKSLRQTMLNLLAAGLFHLVEQQLATLSKDAGFNTKPLKEIKMDVIAKWYMTHFGIDFKKLTSWPLIKELRYVANTVKHGEGSSSHSLKALRPELFRDPVFSKMAAAMGTSVFQTDKVVAPLAGEDLFVSEDILRQYAEGAEAFFFEIAAHFATHEDD